MRYISFLFFVFICNITESSTSLSIDYKKIKRHIKEHQLFTYTVGVIGLFMLGGFSYIKGRNSHKNKPSKKTSILFPTPNSVTKQKDQLIVSFLVIDPETKEVNSILKQNFDYYRAELSPCINKISLIYTKDLCAVIRNALCSENQNKYANHEIVLFENRIPENKTCLCDAGFITGATIFTLVPKNTSSQ